MAEAPPLHMPKWLSHTSAPLTLLLHEGPKAQIWNHLCSRFPPSLAAIPILLNMSRSPSIPFWAVMCLITHLLPGDSGDCQEEKGSCLSHAALSARSVQQNQSGPSVGKFQKFSGSPSEVRRALQRPSSLRMAQEQATEAAMHYVYAPAQ